MPEDDPLAAALAALLKAWEEACTAAHGGNAAEKPLLTAARLIEAGDGLAKALAALDAVLTPHSPRSDRVPGSSCFTHRNSLNTMLPVPGCGNCVQDRQREVCPECRDEFGGPVLFQDCRVRSATMAGLTGEANGR